MRKNRILMLLLVVCMIMATATSCKGSEKTESGGNVSVAGTDDASTEPGETPDDTTSDGGAVTGDDASTAPAPPMVSTAPSNPNVAPTPVGFYDDIRGTTVKVYVSDKPDALRVKRAESFEKEYGCKVEWNIVSWNTWHAKFAATVTSGKPIDVVPVNDTDFINYAAQALIQPIDSYIEYNDALWDRNVMELYTWRGKHYGMYMTWQQPDTSYIWYNKTMFEDAGVREPYDYYQKGEWNFENFRKVAKEMTQDTNGDKTPDIYGFGTTQYFMFMMMNGNSVVSMANDGIKVTLDQPSAVPGLQILQDMQYKDHSMPINFSADVHKGFPERKFAMILERGWHIIGVNDLYNKKVFPDDIGFCPPPKGPDAGDRYYAPTMMEATGVSTGAKNPKGAAAWVYHSAAFNEKAKNDPATVSARRKTISDVHMKQANDFLSKAVVINTFSNGLGNWGAWNTGGQFLMMIDITKNNTPPATAISKYIGSLKSEVTSLNAKK